MLGPILTGGVPTSDPTADYLAQPVAVATQDEAEAGTNNTDAMTPLRVKQAAGALLATVIRVTTGSGTTTYYPAAANTDAARGDALSLAMQAVTSGGYLYCPPGNYLMHLMSNLLLDGVTYKFDNSRLYIDNTSASPRGGAYSTWLLYSDQPTVSGWRLLGPLILDGANIASCSGIVIQDGADRTIRDVKLTNWADKGFWHPGGTLRGNRIESVFATTCGTGFHAGGEYDRFTDCIAISCGTGFVIEGGNNRFVACSSSFNETVGVQLIYNENGGHGVWIGGDINHGTTYNIKIATDFTRGFSFVGAHIYSGGTIDLGGEGVVFTGGDIASNFSCSGGSTGLVVLDGVRFPQAIPGSYLTALTPVQRAQVKLLNCATLTALYAPNDLISRGLLQVNEIQFLALVGSAETSAGTGGAASAANGTITAGTNGGNTVSYFRHYLGGGRVPLMGASYVNLSWARRILATVAYARNSAAPGSASATVLRAFIGNTASANYSTMANGNTAGVEFRFPGSNNTTVWPFVVVAGTVTYSGASIATLTNGDFNTFNLITLDASAGDFKVWIDGVPYATGLSAPSANNTGTTWDYIACMGASKDGTDIGTQTLALQKLLTF